MENQLKSLSMGNKRNHKVMITDIAIDKVPFVKYKTIPENEFANLQNLAKRVLKLSKEKNNSNEVAIIYSLEHEKLMQEGRPYLGISFGTKHGVNPLENPISFQLLHTATSCVMICIHNHPSLSKISLDDVSFFLKQEQLKMLIAVTNLGSISYIVKSDKYNFNYAVDILNQAITINNTGNNLKDYQKAALYFLNNCYKANIIYQEK